VGLWWVSDPPRQLKFLAERKRLDKQTLTKDTEIYIIENYGGKIHYKKGYEVFFKEEASQYAYSGKYNETVQQNVRT